MFAFIGITSPAFADHLEVTITTVDGSGFSQECVETGCYDPSDAVVDVGGKVIMTNTDTAGIHTFTSGTVDGFAASPDGNFDSGILNANDSFEWNPSTVGEYPYYCMLHVWMQGSIIVEASSPSPTPTITVSTDKNSYIKGDEIKVFGKITNPNNDTAIQIVTKYSGNTVNITQISHDQNGLFSTTIESGGPLWDSGSYELTVYYGDISTTKIIDVTEKITCSGGYELVNGECRPIEIPSTISVQSDKLRYDEGDTIKISGKVTNYEPGTMVTVVIESASENHTSTRETTPNIDGTFLISLPSDPAKFKNDAIYTFTATYENISATDNFYFYAVDGGETESGPGGETESGPGGETESGPGGETESGPGGETESGPGGETESGPSPEIYAAIAGVVIAAIAGVVIYLKIKKSSGVKSQSSTESSGHSCNVCGTTIPEGKNVCPNCGDTYSV